MPTSFDTNITDINWTGTPNALLDSQFSGMAVRDLLPLIAQFQQSQYAPEGLAQLGAAQATSPGFAQLMAELYGQYGPQMNQIGSDISAQNARRELATNQELMSGGGMDLLRSLDPEYFKTREATSNRLGDLLASINLGSGLSGTEQREIEQGLAREGTARGTYGSPSQSETVANAMRYGEAGRNRELQNQNSLSQAIAASTAFLPASRTGAEGFALATGKTAGQNTGENKFTGIFQPQTSGIQSITNQLMSGALTSGMNAANLQAQKPSAIDQFGKYVSAAGQVVGGIAKGVGMMCWVAREVYGESNPRWLEFREWMLNKAPAWFRDAYLCYGPDYARSIHNNSQKKELIRNWMNKQLGY